ncbi:MAG: twin-arginine translocase TatA/TatE family subunit [Crocinitomicaceae bacterium]
MDTLLFINKIGMGSAILILVVVLILFGGKKLPEMMKGMGKGIKGFKDELNGDGDEKTAPTKSEPKSEEK